MQLIINKHAVDYYDLSGISFYFYSLSKKGVQFEAECDVDEVEIVYDWTDGNMITTDYMFISLN